MAKAVIVVDMQRGFLEEGYPLFCGEEARKIIPNVKKLLEEELAKESALFFTADTHDPDDKEFQMFPPHCIRGTKEAEIIPELAEFVEKGTLVPKRRYSGFFQTELEEHLAEFRPDKVIVVGVCTSICVLSTVGDLRNRDYPVVVPKDCVADFDAEMHRFALRLIKNIYGAEVV